MFQKHTIPFGPNVVLIKSAIAMAPTNDACKDMALANTASVQKNQKVHRSKCHSLWTYSVIHRTPAETNRTRVVKQLRQQSTRREQQPKYPERLAPALLRFLV